MNAARRKQIAEARELIELALDKLLGAAGDEQQSLENLPVSLQYSDRGIAMEEAAAELDNAADELEAVVSTLEELS